MVEYVDGCRFTAGSSGTADFADGTAVTGWRNLSSAGAVNTSLYTYRATSSDGSQWEIGSGAYASAGGGTLARTTVIASSTGSKVNFTNPPEVIVTLLKTGIAEFKKVGRRQIPVYAADMVPRITNGPAFGIIEMATNDNTLEYLAFDPTTQEFADFIWFPPASWDLGTITFRARWFHPSTTTNFGVAWQLAGVAISNDDTLDVALGTAVVVTDTGGTTSDFYLTSESTAITIAGTPAAGDAVFLRVARAPANGSDNMAVDAYLIGIEVFYTETAAAE